METGLYPSMPFADYLGVVAASKSLLWTIHEQSPAHAFARMNGATKDTPALRIGRLVHTAVLEPDTWSSGYVRGPDGDYRTKKVKEALVALEGEHPDAEILKPDDFDLCMSIRDAVAAHPKGRRLIEGRAEVSMVWDDPDTGVRCKGRADLLSDRAPAVVDLKTAADASPAAFSRAIANLGYHIQGAHYLEGSCELGHHAEHFVFVVVEKAEPFAVACYELSAAALGLGADIRRDLLCRWRDCMETGDWPGYSAGVPQIDLPAWAYK